MFGWYFNCVKVHFLCSFLNSLYLYRVQLGSTQEDHHSLLSDLRAASVAKNPLKKVLDARNLTEQYRYTV